MAKLLSYFGVFTPARIDTAAILLMPLAAFIALRLPPISQNNFTDAMYYLGYAHNFTDLVNRYGFIYYAVRFGPIFSELGFAALFGSLTGFHVLRYLLAIAVGFALHAVLRERYGRRAALLGVIAWSFSPLTARILLSTYVDSTAVPFTMLGMLLLLKQQGRSPARALLAGALLCAGVSGNVYAGVMIAFGLPAYALLSRGRPLAEVAKELAIVLVGAAIPLALFTLLYDQLFGIESLLKPAIDVTLRLAGGDAKQWSRPPAEWLVDSPHIYAPFTALAGTLAAWHWTRDRLALAAALYLACLVAFYWLTDLAFDGYSLSFYPYGSYWQGALMLASGAITGLALQIGGVRDRAAVAALLILALAGPPMIFGLLGARPPPLGWLTTAGAAALALLAATVRWPRLRPVALAGLLATGGLLQTGSGVYNSLLGKPQSNDRDLVQAALQLSDLLPRFRDDGKDLAIWYSPDDDDRRLKMIQSIQLPFSQFEHPDGRPVKLAALSSDALEVLRNPQLGHLVLLDYSRERIDAALAELGRHQIPHRVAQRRRLGSRRLVVELAHVILDHPTGRTVATYPATDLRSGPEAMLRYDTDGATLISGPRFFAWDATLDLSRLVPAGTPITVTVTLQSLRGRASLALIQRGAPDRVLQENIVAATPAPVRVSVRARDGGAVSLLAVRNQMSDGTRAVIRILSVTVHEDPQPVLRSLSRAQPTR